MARAADFSGLPPGAKALMAAGFTTVIRYIGLGRESKRIHRTEWEDYTREGMQVLLVAELGADDAWATPDDYETGATRARLAMADLMTRCPTGVDPNRVRIACAADAHASSAQEIADAIRYASGFASVLGKARTGFYGFGETSRAVHAADVVGWHWRCGSEPTQAEKAWVNFWQRNVAPTTISLGGTIVDINEAFAALTPLNGSSTKEDIMRIRLARTVDNPTVWAGNGMTRRPIQDMAELGNLQWWLRERYGQPDSDVEVIGDIRVLGAPIGGVGETVVAGDVAALLIPAAVSAIERSTADLTDAQLQAIAKAAADEQDRRARDGHPATGPTS